MAWRENRRTVCTLYFCLCLLYTNLGLGKTPDNNQEIKSFQPIDGDILLTKDQMKEFEEMAKHHSYRDGSGRSRRAVVVVATKKWENAVVPYEIDSSVGENAVRVIRAAIAQYTIDTCIEFREKTSTDEDYIVFYPGEGCMSNIGRVGGRQTISVGSRCESIGVVIHEIFHALGRWHEHSRPDRDQYVEILTNNIQPESLSNFDVEDSSKVDTQGVAYDYDSIMHYEHLAFSRNGRPTIRPLAVNVLSSRLGQRNGFSRGDLDHINALYCGGPPGQWSSWGEWNECSVTCNGGHQVRMRSCVGGVNCTGRNIQDRTCNEEQCEKPSTWGSWSSWSGCSLSCGGGRRTRLRTCQNGNMCGGPQQQFEDCNEQQCPSSSEWSEWSSWSKCNQTCEGGIQTRRRFCRLGNDRGMCPRHSSEQQPCNSGVLCETDPDDESEWGTCSRPCGGGTQFRVSGGRNQHRACNDQPCHDEVCLSGLSQVGCYTPPEGLKSLEGSTTDLSDDPKTRTEPVRKCATKAVQDGYKVFALVAGSCHSGMSSLEEFTAGNQSNLCTELDVAVAVDVYNVTDLQAFKETARLSESCGREFCTARELVCSSGRRANLTWLLLCSLTLLAWLFVV